MSRIQRLYKRYERQVLLGLVVFLLLIFSVGGAIQCQPDRGPAEVDYGGSFQATPTTRVTLDSGEFLDWRGRYARYQANMLYGTRRYLPFLYQGRGLPSVQAAWAHIVESSSAHAAGYRVGLEYELPRAIQEAVSARMQGLQFTDALYDRFLREFFRGSAADFQATLEEVLRKDHFLRPLIDSFRYSIPYEQAYEAWKVERERVDLRYIALEGEDFSLPVRRVETTRSVIAGQEETLVAVTTTTRTLNRLRAQARAYAEEHDGAWPPDAASIPGSFGEGTPTDAWGGEIAYEAGEDAIELTSPGPDGTLGTADDVDLDTLAWMDTLASLRRVGDALLQWRGAAGAWPRDLAALREPPTEDTLAPLRGEAKDGWGRDLVYEAPSGEDGAPRVLSLGPDGEASTADDHEIAIDEDRVVVPAPAGAFGPYLDEEVRDAWDRPLAVQLKDAPTQRWEVASAGPDGERGTADDVTTGNAREIEAYFSRPDVRSDYQLPLRRRFQALYLHLPLLPDEVLARLWKDFPEHHPDEMKAFERWRAYSPVPYYGAEDPADEVAGHGAELARRMAPDAEPTLVPDAAIFGEVPPDLLDEADPDYEAYMQPYVEQGWRAILLREQLVENIFNAALIEARDSRQAHAAWERARDEGIEDPGEEPEVVTFETLLDRWADYLPGEADAPWMGLYETPEPLTREAWEAEAAGKPVDGIQLTLDLQSLREDGTYANVPTNLHEVQTKAILRSLEFLGQRPQSLHEVRDEVFERYLGLKQLDRAQDELERLRREVERRQTTAEGGEAGAEDGEAGDPFAAALEAWAEDLGVPYQDERTGMFIGARPPVRTDAPEGADEEAAARHARRAYVRFTGYETVRARASRQDDVAPEPGTFGRRILRDEADDGTGSAYLVRVVDRAFPPPEAFSPREYTDHLTRELLRDLLSPQTLPENLLDRQGVLLQRVAKFFADLDWLRSTFDLRTAADLNTIAR